MSGYARFKEPAYVSLPDPLLPDTFECEVGDIELTDEDGYCFGFLQDIKLVCETTDGGGYLVNDILAFQPCVHAARFEDKWVDIDRFSSSMARAVCDSIRRQFECGPRKADLDAAYDAACEALWLERE